MNINPISKFLKKNPKEFSKTDIVRYIEEKEVKMVQLLFVGEDGCLRKVNINVHSKSFVDQLLTWGEMIDGSSVFPSSSRTKSTSIILFPRLSSSFVNPFEPVHTLNFLCSVHTYSGKNLESSSEYILKKADDAFQMVTGMEVRFKSEVEFYLYSEDDPNFSNQLQNREYSISPYSIYDRFTYEWMNKAAQCGVLIQKGYVKGNYLKKNDYLYEQHVVELSSLSPMMAADQLTILKWVLKNCAFQHNLKLTFAPVVDINGKGNDLIIHSQIVKNGKNQMFTDLKLNSIGRTAIAGYLFCTPALTAFGNSNALSYLKVNRSLNKYHYLFWGDERRTAPISIPQRCTQFEELYNDLSSSEKPVPKKKYHTPFITHKTSDFSSEIYLLLASHLISMRHGFEMEEALKFAESHYIDVDIDLPEYKGKFEHLVPLPSSCFESADELSKQRTIFEKHAIFPTDMIDNVIRKLKKIEQSDWEKMIQKDHDLCVELIDKNMDC
ncbi:MAG TPA: hypothetical protein PLH70_03085 [Bacteroidales bacterium]|nr:hypothetical protein [Bacteroidales bacterium]HOH22085.1 hypothetical protein [Bacteroidales bacterium]HPZ03454.1 hypothetical protein [Bacteroidales bacterium]HQB74767.1 hypothetical protein [Bacteroidales bacterium]